MTIASSKCPICGIGTPHTHSVIDQGYYTKVQRLNLKVAELEREITKFNNPSVSADQWRILAETNERLSKTLQDYCDALERKLAEQQAALFTVRTILAGCDASAAIKAKEHMQKHFADNHEELNKLLSQEREKAVPEGIVSVEAGFDYLGYGVTQPTLKLFFAAGHGQDCNQLWVLRDKAKALLTPSPASLNKKEGGK